jgi:outer membrane protein insertion porin family
VRGKLLKLAADNGQWTTNKKLIADFESTWCVEVLKDLKQTRLSPFLVAVLAASATFGLAKPISGQTLDQPNLDTKPIESANSAEAMPTAKTASDANSSSISKPVYVNEDAIPIDLGRAAQLSEVKSATAANVIVETKPGSQNPITQPLTVQAPEPTPTTPTPTTPTPTTPTPTTPTPTTPTPTTPTPTTPTPTTPTPTTPTPTTPTPTTPTPTNETQAQPTAEPEPRVLVAEVVVSGAGPLEDRVFQVVGTRAGRATTRSQLQADVNAIFATGYFSSVNVQPEDTPLGVRVAFVVQLNPVLRQVSVNTVPEGAAKPALPQQVVDEIFGTQYGQILNLNDLQDGIKKLNQWYKENGYDLAQVLDASQVTADGRVTLVVAEGVVEDIRVRFLNKEAQPTDEKGEPVRGRTRDFIITREVQLRSGDVFNRRTAERDLRRVFGLGIFDDVRLSFAPGQDPRKVVVVVDVIEKNTGSVAAGAGISSSSGLFGSVSYQEQNLGGNNQTIGGEVQVGQRELLFDARFTDPWIAGDPYRTSYTVNAFRRRSISLIFDGGPREVFLPNGDRPRVLRLGGGVNFTRPLSRDVFSASEWTASLGLQYQRVSIRNGDGDLSPVDQRGNNLSFSGSGTDDLLTVQFGAVRDRRNDLLRPTSGSLLRLGVEQSVPVGEGSIFLTRLRGSYSYYIPVRFTSFTKGSQTLAFNIQGGTVLGDLPPYEAFSLGGSNSVRGYDEGDVGAGRSFIQATAEYRFPIISVVGGALFVDFATDLGSGSSVLGDPAGVRGKPGNGFGYGIGIRVQSPLGPIRIDYGFNDEGRSRIHFGIGERF